MPSKMDPAMASSYSTRVSTTVLPNVRSLCCSWPSLTSHTGMIGKKRAKRKNRNSHSTPATTGATHYLSLRAPRSYLGAVENPFAPA